MPTTRFFARISIVRKDLLMIFILFNTFTWWYMTLVIMDRVINDINLTYQQTLVLWGVYQVAVIGSSLVAATLSNKIERARLLYMWIILGVMTSFLPTMFREITTDYAVAIFFLFGVSFGIGMPSCLAYFADNTVIENRGTISGVIFLSTNLSALLLQISLSLSDMLMASVISAIWRGLAIIALFSIKSEVKTVASTERRASFTSIFRDKSFVLYLVAWLMFCFIDQLEGPILRNFFGKEFWGLKIMMEPLVSSISAVAGGLLCDRIGRKRMVIYGFVTLGIAYALIGVAPQVEAFWYLYSVIDGIAWGIFMVTFILTLWGDISPASTREKYYLIGSTPFFFTDFIRLLSIPYAETTPMYAAFSLASFFLFLAVLPLMYAPETLPEKKMEIRRLKGYIEQAKKITEKYTKKNSSKS